ncbi:hypothetical protein [Streptomyces sp. NPDC005876]|uniref:hypothetical protein n=1 Tax=unclassified Streptomyces TaxID=2593676 RepID=UPI0033CEF549
MKPLKAAAVVLGSVVLAGTAAPAFAQEPAGTGLRSAGLDGPLDTVAESPVQVVPLRHRPEVLGPDNPASRKTVLDTLKGIGVRPDPVGGLLGGLPLTG